MAGHLCTYKGTRLVKALSGPQTSSTGHGLTPAASLRREIIQSFYANLKKVQNRGGSTGEARASRWKENQGGAGDEPATGNAGNAAAVAATKAREVCNHHDAYPMNLDLTA